MSDPVWGDGRRPSISPRNPRMVQRPIHDNEYVILGRTFWRSVHYTGFATKPCLLELQLPECPQCINFVELRAQVYLPAWRKGKNGRWGDKIVLCLTDREMREELNVPKDLDECDMRGRRFTARYKYRVGNSEAVVFAFTEVECGLATLPEPFDVVPFLAELWRLPRPAGSIQRIEPPREADVPAPRIHVPTLAEQAQQTVEDLAKKFIPPGPAKAQKVKQELGEKANLKTAEELFQEGQAKRNADRRAAEPIINTENQSLDFKLRLHKSAMRKRQGETDDQFTQRQIEESRLIIAEFERKEGAA